jgi:hypothetical protein
MLIKKDYVLILLHKFGIEPMLFVTKISYSQVLLTFLAKNNKNYIKTLTPKNNAPYEVPSDKLVSAS